MTNIPAVFVHGLWLLPSSWDRWVDTDNPERGPLLILSGEKDHTVPWALSNAAYKQQKDNPGVTEIPGHGHALTIDSGWREVAERALEFVQRFV